MKINWVLTAVIGTFTFLLSISPIGYAWHENLGIDANKAAELYQTKPNDPAIVQWKNALQLAINDMGKCFDVKTAISCESLMSIINSNCKSHPNELLACNDVRIAQYPSVLKTAQELQKKAEEAKQKTVEDSIKQLKKQYSSDPNAIGNEIINKCIHNDYANLKFEAASPFCDGELRSLHKNCQVNSTGLYYCKDERLTTFATQNNTVNSTASP